MKQTIVKLFTLAFMLMFFACEAPKKEESQTEQKIVKRETPFEKTLAYHGGIENWNNFGTLKFERSSARGVSSHVIDLKNRNEKITNPDHILTFAENGFWTNKVDDKLEEKMGGMRFQRNLWFYFFGLPFVTADPGANQEVIADGILKGKSYDRVKITFDENVGDAPDDQYILWLDKTSGLLELINYSVTYGRGKSASEKYNAIVFNEWQEVNGMKVPKKFQGHVWAGDTLGDVRYEFEFANVSFSAERPPSTLFDTEEGATFKTYE